MECANPLAQDNQGVKWYNALGCSHEAHLKWRSSLGGRNFTGIQKVGDVLAISGHQKMVSPEPNWAQLSPRLRMPSERKPSRRMRATCCCSSKNRKNCWFSTWSARSAHWSQRRRNHGISGNYKPTKTTCQPWGCWEGPPHKAGWLQHIIISGVF